MAISRDIKISIETQYREEQSLPMQQRFVFSYTITIRNYSHEMIQLMERYWQITDGNGAEHTVQGEGVVGQQPTIAPGQAFQYTSGSVLETPFGTMQGHYLMQLLNGDQFQVPIPVFRLNATHQLH